MARSSHSIGEPLFQYDAKPEQPEDTARREEYRLRLAEYLKNPEFRAIEGFPIGSDEDILALSDPPYYTACPNPFLPEILEQWQTERQATRQKLNLPLDDAYYRCEPFAADVSEGKNDPIYNAHSYHTKVPHKAIMRYILHYTDPGDIVFDGFCGTGMAGVAAQLCGDKAAVEALGYTVKPDGRILDESGKPISRLGARKAVLNDLSPAATFIAYNFNSLVDAQAFEKEAKRILKEVEAECGWMYETCHPHCLHPHKVKGKINFTVWSDVFSCPHCGVENVFWCQAVDKSEGKVLDEWECRNCGTLLSKSPTKGSGAIKAEKVWEVYFDEASGKALRKVKQVPAFINYSIGNKRFEKKPDEHDIEIYRSISEGKIPFPYPTNELMRGDKTGDPLSIGITHTHHFYTKRNLWVLSSINDKIARSSNRRLLFWFTSALTWCGRENRLHIGNYFEKKGGVITSLRGTWYVASLSVETNVVIRFSHRKKSSLYDVDFKQPYAAIGTGSANQLAYLPENCLDYVFIDPPFGSNLMYSELNFLWESWLRIFTENKPEVIINNSQKKNLLAYQRLIEESFMSFYRLIKHGRWMTVEFHNSQNAVWIAIQEGLLRTGFVVADVRTLDKQKSSFNQANAVGAVKQDLVITAYKPSEDFENRFKLEGGTEAGAWAFIRQHLEQLPPPNLVGNVITSQAERMPYLLYDRLVAFHLVRGLTVPISAGDFYAGLGQRFLARDGMYFTASQAADYDRLRLKAEKVEQLALFVTDEDSAIQWLRQALDPARGGKPQSYSDLMPEFLKQLHQEKHEKMPELMVMLEQNFLQDPAGQWYAPDPDKQADLDALRAKVLLHEFADYLKSKGKLKVFRSEAVRAGFSKAWKERDYETIVKVGERLPEAALQEDPKLKMYFDNALSRYQRGLHQEAML